MKKVLYIALLIASCTITYWAGKIPAHNKIAETERVLSSVNHWETIGNTLYIYTNDGNYYSIY